MLVLSALAGKTASSICHYQSGSQIIPMKQAHRHAATEVDPPFSTRVEDYKLLREVGLGATAKVQCSAS